MKSTEPITDVHQLVYVNHMQPFFTVHIKFWFWWNTVGPVRRRTGRSLEKLGEGNSALVDTDDTT